MKGGDALFQRRVAPEKTLKTPADAAGNTEGGHLVGKMRLIYTPAQLFQGRHHLLPTCHTSAPGIGPKFSLTAEPENDGAGQDSENQLSGDGGNKKGRAMAMFGPENNPVHQMAHHP